MGSEFGSIFDGIRRHVYSHGGKTARIESPRAGAASTPGKSSSVRFAPPSPGGGLSGGKRVSSEEHYLRTIQSVVENVFK